MAVVLAAWSLVVFTLTLRPFAWHIDYFSHPGPQYRPAIIALLCLIVPAAAVYAWLRRYGMWRWEPRLLTGLALVVALVFEPAATLVCFWLVASCYAAGSAALARFDLDPGTPAARIPLAIGAGLGGLILLLIPLGLAGLYRPWIFALMLAAPCIAFRHRLVDLGRDLRALDQAWRSSQELRSPLAGVAMALAPLFLASFLMAALAPAIAYDAVSHHLPAARHYLLGGELVPLPVVEGSFRGSRLFSLGHSVAYSYYPQSFEELLTLAWGLGGQSAAQLVTPVFLVLSLLTTLAIGRLCGLSRLGAVVGLAAAATLPFAHWTGAIAKNDYPVAFFELAALYAVLRARQGGSDRWLFLTAFFIGLSFGVKHVAAFAGVPLGLLLLDQIRRRRQPFRLALAMGLIFAAAGLFWHARAYLLTGNPIYPAGTRFVSTDTRALDGSFPPRSTAYLLYPWIVHFDGRKVMESPSANPLGFYFVFFACAWVLARRRRRCNAELACLFFAAVYYLCWGHFLGVLRYALAPLLVLALLTSERVAALDRQGGAATRAIVAAVMACCLVFALLPTLILEVNGYQFGYFSGRLDKAGYLRATLSDYGAIEFLNAHAGPREFTVAVNNCASVYANDPAQFRCIHLPDRVLLENAAWITEVVESAAPDYLVLPTVAPGKDLRPGFTSYAEPIFRDAAFQVLPRKQSGRSHSDGSHSSRAGMP